LDVVCKHYLLDFNWYRAITQRTRTVNVLTPKLGIKIDRKGIPTQMSVAFLQLRLNGWMGQDKEVGLGPGHVVLDGDPAPTATSPHFSVHVYCGQTVAHLSATAELLYFFVYELWS